MRLPLLCSFFVFASVCIPASGLPAQVSSKVLVRANPDGAFELLRNGKPFFVKGVGGSGFLADIAANGGNSLRTWGVESLEKTVDGKPFLDRCHELGIAVTAGIWVQHERHGANYNDPKFLREQREKVRAAVLKYKNHPALLIWGLGNEMEGPIGDGSNPAIWKELNELAAIIKKEDPDHPVMTVIASASRAKVEGIKKYYPNIDILGVNAYAAASGVGKALMESNWTKPFMLTEFGPVGHWEVRKTAWGAPIEPTSREKAASYYATQTGVVQDGKGHCLGTFAFVWGSKQETTSTWYGMFLKSGEKLPPVDAMTKAWTGEWPQNRCPRVESFTTSLREAAVKPGVEIKASVKAIDANNDKLSYEWIVMEESRDTKVGGDAESVPPSHPECIVAANEGELTLRTPSKPGAYRLFLIVKDGKGAASADNVPFRVER